MKVSSFVRVGHELVPAEVELTLVPGLPQFTFIGLPDAALRESALRIRAAIREQGFELPQAQQILVHIKPTFLKKTSRGLDLAIACALLWETGQLTLPPQTPTLYGELTLKGDVVQPDDLPEVPIDALSASADTAAAAGGPADSARAVVFAANSSDGVVVTGTAPTALSFASRQIANLASMIDGGSFVSARETLEFVRPPLKITEIPRAAADFARVVAAGEHSLLLAGPSGTGKSTFAEAIASWIEAPTMEQIKEVRHFWRGRNEPLRWRPVLRPHHSVTPLAMVGGGASLWPGEITRAHGGLLIMDELLEFHPEIQEALREPIETGSISLVRAGRSRTYPARVLLVATTNLCACGNFVPRKRPFSRCRCSKTARRRILTRLTGPFVDRFALIALTDEWSATDAVPTSEISADVAKAIAFRRFRGQRVPNSRLLPEVIEESLSDFQREKILRTAARSRRRKAALLQVARTFADLRESLEISTDDLERARRLTNETHQILEEWMD